MFRSKCFASPSFKHWNHEENFEAFKKYMENYTVNFRVFHFGVNHYRNLQTRIIVYQVMVIFLNIGNIA